jgi:hypothetical protein
VLRSPIQESCERVIGEDYRQEGTEKNRENGDKKPALVMFFVAGNQYQIRESSADESHGGAKQDIWLGIPPEGKNTHRQR